MATLTVAQFLDRLALRASPDKAANWDAIGLQLGDPRAEVKSVAVCHEVTDAVVEKLETTPADLLVTYHPLLFHPTTRIVAGPGSNGRAYRLLCSGVATAVMHTNFDVATGGAADALAEAFGLQHIRGFGPVEPGRAFKLVTFLPEDAVEPMSAALELAGAGRIGNYHGCSFRIAGEGAFYAGEGTTPQLGGAGANRAAEVRFEMVFPAEREAAVVAALVGHHPYEEPPYDLYPVRSNLGLLGRVGHLPQSTQFAQLVEEVKAKLRAPAVRIVRTSDPVSRVAVIPGAGSNYLRSALSAGAEVLVTGDVSHHSKAEARDMGLGVIDPGHAATEQPGMRVLVSWVGDIVPDVIDLTPLWDEGE